MPSRRRLRWESIRSLLERVWKFILIFLGVYVAAGVAFYLVEDGRYTLFDSLYWSISTLGTVGYGDVVPTVSAAKVLTTIVIFTQIFLLGYLFTVITSAVTEESQRRALGMHGTSLTRHIVVLGYSGVGRAAVRELLIQEQTVAVVTDEVEQVPNIRSLAPEEQLFVTFGPPAELEILRRANVPQAHAVIVCTADDATNMIGALNVRALSPTVRIVVSVSRPELRDTLRAAGVTYVASPSDMGGRLCASAAFEPEVAHALDDITAADVHADMREYILPSTSPLAGKTFAEADALIRQGTGCLLVGYAHPDTSGEYATRINPPFTTKISAGDAVILLATVENAKRCDAWFGLSQGR
ncbi:MAG: potassium channel protein [Thermoplasmata archaeon]|nr:potassium channel protein [Thermoplasmata archaeon]